MMLKTILVFLGLFSLAYGAIDSVENLSYDENDRLSKHYLLHAGFCPGISNAKFPFRETQEATGSLKDALFGTNEAINSKCNMVCLEVGWKKSHVVHPTPRQVYDGKGGLREWVNNNCQKVEWGMINYLPNSATVYWINDEQERVAVGTAEPGERHTFWITSYLGHEFDVIDNENEDNVFHFVVRYNSINHIGEYVSGVITRDVHEEVRNTFEGEWDRVSQVTRTFTSFGFNKGKLPIHLFGSMAAYYYNNRNQATIEEWGGKGVFVNWWETDVLFVSMPFQLKKYWQSELKQLVEAWVGVPLELTDIYGMRRYEDGARLLTHVDRINTHAASLIINVDQLEMREPWMIEIYDFGNRLHEIEMNPGDIVYYESARCLHGRMQPLRGKHYVNLFAHYRPIDENTGKGDPYWYMKPNPDWTPEQVLDVGQCHSNGTKAFCNGPVSAPYLSPKLQTLHGPQDLYQFWVDSGEPNYRNIATQGINNPHKDHSEL